MSIYTPIGFINDSPPPINASNLNYMQAGIEANSIDLASQAVQIASMTYYASTLYANIGANGTAIAVNASNIYQLQATQGAQATQIADLTTTVAAQTAAIASNTQGVASVLPAHDALASQVAGLSASSGAGASQIADILATQGAQATQIADVLATQGAQATQIADLVATQTDIIAVNDAQATNLAEHATQIYDLGELITTISGGLTFTNRSGNGPVDFWSDVGPVPLTATSGVPRAIGLKFVPPDSLEIGSGVANLSLEVLANAGVASPTLDFSTAVLDVSGNVLFWSTPTVVPSVATAAIIEEVTVPLEGPTATLIGGEAYYLVLASDDRHRFSVLGRPAGGGAAGVVRHRRGLVYEWDLPSGLDLASYIALPVDVASSFSPVGYPGLFVSES